LNDEDSGKGVFYSKNNKNQIEGIWIYINESNINFD